MRRILRIIGTLVFTSFITSTRAQTVDIPDPGLNAAVRDALQKPTGPLTQQDLLNLTVLDAHDRNISSVTGLEAARNLNTLLLFSNQFTNLNLPADLRNLISLDLDHNRLISLTLPPGLTNLGDLYLSGNQLTNLTLPPDMTHLTSLVLDGNPLTRLVLSEQEAIRLPGIIVTLQNQGIPVFTYPLTVQLAPAPQSPIGAFRFSISGPPGDYIVFSSTNLADWSVMGAASNPLGRVFFTDVTAHLFPRKFYRAQLQGVPANLVFIPASTFLLGSPTNEIGHEADEGPQTLVTLSHGFWIGKYEVTQAEFFAVTGDNPNSFPGDPNRPVESVSFFAASNYCVQRTEQDLAAGRIPPGTHYRLPTEAEWECAARAGTTNRFYYGADPNLTDLPNYAWFGAQNGFTTHPVGQKLPNAWGLYDMEGNVWEWCQDWYGNYPGGSVTDPQGPATNPVGWKVIRGGAWESSEFECRSASRWFEPASPFINDFIIGFRVVLVSDL